LSKRYEVGAAFAAVTLSTVVLDTCAGVAYKNE
jgi:hypothetical protein